MDKLVSYLTKKTDFFTAPACETGLGACEGGLLRNSLNVMSRMCMEIGADATETGEDVNALLDSVTVVSLLSGIWKANYYRPVMKQKKDEKGKEVEYVAYYRPKPPEERLCFGKDDDHGDEAVYIIQSYIKLSREEALAIRSQEWNPRSVEAGRIMSKCPLAMFLHVADLKNRYLDMV